MGVARVKMTHEFICKALGFPDGTEFFPLISLDEKCCMFFVKHEELKGDPSDPPLIKPMYERVGFDWNQECLKPK